MTKDPSVRKNVQDPDAPPPVNPAGPSDEARADHVGDAASHSLVRIKKKIVIGESDPAAFDESIVQPAFYNSFNYATSGGHSAGGSTAIGVTATRSGDGTSLVAANLAANLALSHEGETALVDLNVRRPKVHEIFRTPLSPGILETFSGSEILMWPTKFERLFVLPAGTNALRSQEGIRTGAGAGSSPLSNLDFMMDFRNLMYSLREHFRTIVVDLPSLEDSDIPGLYTKQLDGVIVVVRSGATHQEDLDRAMFHLGEEKLLGFVFNRVSDDLYL